MALVVLLRGVNVGGHRTFRPAALADELGHLGAVNIGAAGTFVVREKITRTRLRAELARRLPFSTDIMMCDGREVASLLSRNDFAREPAGRDVVRFASLLARRPRGGPDLPVAFPPEGRWELQLVAREGRFLIGRYRRQMKAIGWLGRIDRLFGVPATTRNWNTITAIARVLENG
jgi:uncharacterized protein (DUF1697 family)